MDMILICRDAVEDSVIGNVAMTMAAKKEGQDVGIIFTEEALAALAGESFGWSPLFQNRDARIKISRNATAMGIEVADARDNRWTDLSRLLKAAKEAGVRLMACPLWSQILDVDGKLPPEITAIDSATMLKELKEAKIIIGGF
jgi:peroxiredoxin family protein